MKLFKRKNKLNEILDDLRRQINKMEYGLAYGVIKLENYKENVQMDIDALKDIVKKYGKLH